MRDLDNSLLGASNLDESISNVEGSSSSTSSQPALSGASSGNNWADAITASIALTNQVIQTRNTPKNEVEQACGVKPLFAGAKKDAWDKCAMNYNSQKSYTPTTLPPTTNAAQEKATNWWLVGGGIVGGLAVLGTIAYFVFRNK